MKNITAYLFILCAVVALSLSSCSKEEIVNPTNTTFKKTGPTIGPDCNFYLARPFLGDHTDVGSFSHRALQVLNDCLPNQILPASGLCNNNILVFDLEVGSDSNWIEQYMSPGPIISVIGEEAVVDAVKAHSLQNKPPGYFLDSYSATSGVYLCCHPNKYRFRYTAVYKQACP